MLIWAIVSTVTSLELRAHGVTATATVVAISKDGKTTNYELEFPLSSGQDYTAWTSNVDSGEQVGGTLPVSYLPNDPSTVQDTRVLARWWVWPVLMPPFALFFGWLGWRFWSVAPEQFTTTVRARYGR
jgi:hypothetical protein